MKVSTKQYIKRVWKEFAVFCLLICCNVVINIPALILIVGHNHILGFIYMVIVNYFYVRSLVYLTYKGYKIL